MDMEWIKTILTLLPIAALIWKAALLSADLKQLTKEHDELSKKFHALRDDSMNRLNDTLKQIEIRLTKIETVLQTPRAKRKAQDAMND